jgi:hypothetical protein
MVDTSTQPNQPSAQDQTIDTWFADTFFNLALPTELQNRLAAARDDLKARLAKAGGTGADVVRKGG